MQQKYSKIFEGEKQQTPLCLLVRQNSTDSLNSLQSVFSQRSFHSNSVGGTASSRVPIQADSKGTITYYFNLTAYFNIFPISLIILSTLFILLKVQKSRKIIFSDYLLSIYHSIRLNELITNIYGFYMIKLNLNKI